MILDHVETVIVLSLWSYHSTWHWGTYNDFKNTLRQVLLYLTVVSDHEVLIILLEHVETVTALSYSSIWPWGTYNTFRTRWDSYCSIWPWGTYDAFKNTLRQVMLYLTVVCDHEVLIILSEHLETVTALSYCSIWPWGTYNTFRTPWDSYCFILL